MADIFDEVAEDLRAERTRQTFRRYGGAMGAFALALVIGLGGWQGWQWYKGREAHGVAAGFLAVNQASEAPGADMTEMARRFGAIAPGAPTGYRMLAEMRQAALLSEAGDKPAAREIWNRVAADPAVDPLWRDLANLLWVLHGLDIDTPPALTARLGPLLAETSPWRASARELQALVTLRAGDAAAARTALLAADAATPAGVRDRAQRVAAQILVAPPAATTPAATMPAVTDPAATTPAATTPAPTTPAATPAATGG